ncbi:MAG TPA: hypothetical protein VH281_09575 [Gaiellaceae bacterium]
MERPEQGRGLPRVAAETEVAAHQEGGVEQAELLVDLGEGEEARVAHPSAPAHLEGAEGDVDGDRLEPPALRLEAVPTRTCAEVEDPALDEAERLTLRLDPLVVGREEPLRTQRGPGVAVVALEAGLAGSPLEVIEQEAPERVLVRVEDPGYAASEVRRPSSAAMGRMAATTFRMWSSRSTPSSSAPR